MEMEEEALLGDRAHHGPGIGKYKTQPNRFRSTAIFIATALLAGTGFILIVGSFILSRPQLKASSHDYLFGSEYASSDVDKGQDSSPSVVTLFDTVTQLATTTVDPPPPVPTLNFDGILEKNLDELKEMVDGTKGYLARDWSLGLGWNNMRYIIEAAVLHAQLLNRTLILPSHVYARTCNYQIKVCEKHAKMINKNDAIHTDQWRKLPMDEQMSWYIPLEIMIDIPSLRSKHPVILLSEYLLLQGLDPERETTSGGWDRSYYHSGLDQPDLFVIPNRVYDPEGVIRVDSYVPETHITRSLDGLDAFIRLDARDITDGTDSVEGDAEDDAGFLVPAIAADSSSDNSADSANSSNSNNSTNSTNSTATTTSTNTVSQWALKLDAKLVEVTETKKKWALDWSETKMIVSNFLTITNDTVVEAVLERIGWTFTHTYEGNLGMDYTKTVIKPIRQVARKSSLRGLVQDFGHVEQKILLIEGEIHLNRKPASLRFTTEAGRDNFTKIVLHDIHVTERVQKLAQKVIDRMDELNKGRLWMAAHMRRGDFVQAGWVMENTIQNHFKRIMDRLTLGRSILTRIALLLPETYKIPDVEPNLTLHEKEPPKEGDFVYIATDERDPNGLQYLRASRAILFEDLVTREDRREFGWPILFSDVVALVEQNVIAKGAGYFYAHAMSSVAGGILNLRAAAGDDPRTALVD